MPLFELYRMTKEKLDSAKQQNFSPSTEPENDFVELVWENGQILMQGQSSKTRKCPTTNSLLSRCLPSHNPKARDKDIGNNTKMGKFGTEDSVLNEIPLSVPSVEMGLNHDDYVVPWLNYSMDESLQHEYCSDFMPELPGVTVNELSSQNNFASFDKRSSSTNQFNREFNIHNDSSLERGNPLKISSVAVGERTRPKSSASQLYTSSSQQCPTSYPYYRSRAPDSNGSSMKNSNENAPVGDLHPISTGSLPGLKMQRQDQRMSTSKSGLMNFSHFTRPFALAKANLQNIGSMSGSGLSRIERMGSKDKSSAASSSNPVDPTPVDSSHGLRKESYSQCQPVAGPSKVDVKPLESKPPQETAAAERSEVRCQQDTLKNDKKPSQILGESATNGRLVSEKTVEPVVASSSVCSGNSAERASDDHPTHNLKRKHHDTEDSECPSEDVEEESVGVKKEVPTRVGGSKRSRAAEVHNLSERRRRDRINEKMRALQELIPNCNKVDKASMLDEAIEYLKTLQLQVQIMSMGASLYMPPMMFQQGMQHMHAAAHMAHYSSMGMGMGMGMGVGYGMGIPDMNGGSSCYPMVHVSPMHRAHFPCPPVSGPAPLQGMAGSNFQLFGIHGHGHPVSMLHAPLTPLSGGPIMKSAMGLNASGIIGPVDNLDAATGSTSKDLVQNVNSQVMQSTGTNSLVNQTSNQCQGTNDGFAQPAGVQENCQAAEVNGHGTFNSSIKNDNESSGAACEHS